MIKKIGLVLLAFLPGIASAQVLAPVQNINDVATKFTQILNTLTVLLISLAVVWIIINVVMYLVAGGDAEKRKEGGKRILYGIIGLFVIISIWGLVSILRNSFATTNTASEDVNAVQINSNQVPKVQ